jgi:hypothetical protein
MISRMIIILAKSERKGTNEEVTEKGGRKENT